MTIYHVPDISCNHCKTSIETALSQTISRDQISIDITERTVRIDGEHSQKDVLNTLDDIGFEARTL